MDSGRTGKPGSQEAGEEGQRAEAAVVPGGERHRNGVGG